MGAPIGNLLLPKSLTASDRQYVDNLIDLKTRTIGSFDAPFSWLYGMQPDAMSEHFPELAKEFGFIPVDEIQIDATTNARDEHQTLGEFCAILAERFGGVVDFGGALWSIPWVGHEVEILGLDWRNIEADVTDVLSKLPGRVIALTYEPVPGRLWACHYGDATFMRAWLQHPDFHMIK